MAINAIKNSGGGGGKNTMKVLLSSLYVRVECGLPKPVFVKTIKSNATGNILYGSSGRPSTTLALTANVETELNQQVASFGRTSAMPQHLLEVTYEEITV